MHEAVREQWPVSVRLEDLERGAFELPASGLFVVHDDYIIPASRVSRKHVLRYHRCCVRLIRSFQFGTKQLGIYDDVMDDASETVPVCSVLDRCRISLRLMTTITAIHSHLQPRT